MCPTMQEDYIEQANAVDGAFNGQPQRKYDLFSYTYNPGWRDHPNLWYGNQPQQGNQGRWHDQRVDVLFQVQECHSNK